jgi:prophage regulatory protein
MRVLRLPDVQAKTGLKTSEIYDRMAEGRFPRPIPLGVRAKGWVESEVDKWIDQLIADRDGTVRP